MPMDSPAADFPVVNLPLTSSVYFKNGNPVRTAQAPLEGLVRVTEGDEGKFIGMGEMDGEGRVAPRRLVVEYPVTRDGDNTSSCDKQGRTGGSAGDCAGRFAGSFADADGQSGSGLPGC